MKLDAFKSLLEKSSPPSGLNELLLALWYDAKGDWEKAHEIAQNVNSLNGAWVHAYLHRKEGDETNAKYWYSRAGKKPSSATLEQEWEEITKKILDMSESRIV